VKPLVLDDKSGMKDKGLVPHRQDQPSCCLVSDDEEVLVVDRQTLLELRELDGRAFAEPSAS
jgi:hypothetical protein